MWRIKASIQNSDIKFKTEYSLKTIAHVVDIYHFPYYGNYYYGHCIGWVNE